MAEEKKEVESAVESPVTHGKKAQIAGFTIFTLVAAGLLIQAFNNMRTAGTPQEVQPQTNTAIVGDSQESIDQFADAQRRAKLRLDQLNKKKAEDEQHQQNLNDLTGKTNNPPSAQQPAQEKPTVSDVYYDFNLQETARVLKARSASIGRANGGTIATGYQVTEPTGKAGQYDSIIADNNKKIKELRDNSNRLLAVAEQVSPGSVARANDVDNQQGQFAPAVNTAPNDFGQTASNRQFTSPSSAGPRPGEVVIPTGTTISAVLQQDVISDYPNTWIAVLQRPVYDINNEYILLPTGTKIIGGTTRASEVNEAIQNRLGFFCNFIERGDGKRIELKKAQGLDGAGIAGLSDQVDYHILARMLGVAAYAIVGLGPSLNDFGTEPQSASSQAVTDITSQTRTVGRSIAQRYLNIVPTVTIRAGTPMKIILEDDLYVTPWEQLTAASYRYAE